jgi:hypothetical protein
VIGHFFFNLSRGRNAMAPCLMGIVILTCFGVAFARAILEKWVDTSKSLTL